MMPAGDQGKARGYFSDGAQPKACPGSQQSMSLGKRAWFGFSWLALGAFLAGLNRLEVMGAEHVPPGGGCYWPPIIYRLLTRSSSPG